MKSIAKQTNTTVRPRFNGAPCAYFDGVYDYFNINEVAYHAKFSQQKWNGPCVHFKLFRHKIFHILLI